MRTTLKRLATRSFIRLYPRLPLRRHLLRVIVRIEGGAMKSRTLREVLKGHHGVTVGLHSYGSLLEPGMADPGTTIGRYVSVGPNVRRFGAAHPLDRASMHPYWYNPRLGMTDSTSDVERFECTISHDAWIGANVVILPGCRRVGTGAVVGAGSVVTQDVADFAVVAGVPARQRSVRLDERARAILQDEQVWALEPSELAAFLDDFEARP